MKIIYFMSGFFIFWAMIGYPLSIIMLGKIKKIKGAKKDYTYFPSVTVMVVAHNEEKVIKAKLNNLLKLSYPKDKTKILVTSDFSSDKTNEIVMDFISNNPDRDIELYTTKNRGGKTNAQNEAFDTVATDYIVFTDANAMLDPDSVNELIASFVSKDIIYASGRLVYTNQFDTETSNSEATYWNMEVKIRKIESDLQTITAGNGALYAMPTNEYIKLDPLRSHDSGIPYLAALNCKRAIYVPSALAFEKAGEIIEDEFKRKVRMNRGILSVIPRTLKVMNIIKYRWFTYFYIGHRFSRNMLWLFHGLLLLSNIALFNESLLYTFSFVFQILFLLISLLNKKGYIQYKIARLSNYYLMTIMAQCVGVYNDLMKKNKPFWKKAESTR